MKRLLPVATAFVGFAIPALLALAPSPSAALGADPSSPSIGAVFTARVDVVRGGVRLANLALGRDVGVDQAPQSARILPASFDLDEAADRIDVLDTVNARIATFDAGGRATAAIPFAGGSRTIGDLVRMPDGTRYALDVVRRQVIRIGTGGGQTVLDEPELGDDAVNERLELQGTHLYVGEPRRPLLGAPPAAPAVRAIPDGRSAMFGVTRVPFERIVLDVVEHAVDGRNTLWAIVDLDDGSQRLVSIDLADPTRAQVRTMDASVFGDVTRRLVTLDRGGAVVMSASRTSLVFTRYEEVVR